MKSAPRQEAFEMLYQQLSQELSDWQIATAAGLSEHTLKRNARGEVIAQKRTIERLSRLCRLVELCGSLEVVKTLDEIYLNVHTDWGDRFYVTGAEVLLQGLEEEIASVFLAERANQRKELLQELAQEYVRRVY